MLSFFLRKITSVIRRKDFISKVVKYNKLDTRLDSIWDYFLCDGKGLFYIRPTQNNYRLYYFRSHEYRSYYNVDGELEEVVIIYSYKVKTGKEQYVPGIGIGGMDSYRVHHHGDTPGQKRYIRLSIKAKHIEETHSEGEMSFDNVNAV